MVRLGRDIFLQKLVALAGGNIELVNDAIRSGQTPRGPDAAKMIAHIEAHAGSARVLKGND